ncbi:MAG: MATE family efflux transporter [Pseudomonadota bacterium]
MTQAESSPEIGHRQVWHLAGPMILSNLSVPLLGMVDTAIMGQLPEAYYLGAVAVGSVVFGFLFMAMNFLRMGTTGLIAQVFGRGDHNEMRTGLIQGCGLALLLAFFMLMLQQPIAWAFFQIMEGSPEVVTHAREYFDVRIWSGPATLVNFVLIGWFLGMQNARGPLYIMLLINGTNIVLDFIFVMGLGMDVAGVALASVIAEYSGLALGLFLVQRELRKYPGEWRLVDIKDIPRIKRMMTLNRDIFLRTLALFFAFAFFTRQGASQGDVILAANAVLMNFFSIMAYGLDGFAHAAEALVGRSIGERDQRKFDRTIYLSSLWCLMTGVLFALFYIVCGVWIIHLLTDLENVREAAYMFLPWLIASPILSAGCFLLDGVFIGASQGRAMRNTMILVLFVFYLPAWYLLQPFGNHGLWAAFIIFLAARTLVMGLAFRRIQFIR